MDGFDELLKKFDDTPVPDPEPTFGKVMVVDDDPNIQQGLKKTLTERQGDSHGTYGKTKRRTKEGVGLVSEVGCGSQENRRLRFIY